jgi:hypothetical protein
LSQKLSTIGGGLHGFLGASCTGSVCTASVVSVTMSVVLRGAKKLRVNTDFGGSLTAADAGTSLLEFLAVCELLSEICPLRLFTSWKSSSWAVDSIEVLFTTPFCPACPLTFRTARKGPFKDGLQSELPCTRRKER